jgi:hypothetical protein
MALSRDDSIAAFRDSLPAFADPVLYQSEQIGFWFDLAAVLMSPARWGTAYDYGARLFVAHNLALDGGADGQGGGQGPGAVTGPVTSASVDKVSYSRDPGAAMDPSNGHWNLTTYGLRYARLVRMVGAGPVQVGAPYGPANAGFGPGGLGAWQGVVFPQSVQ